MHLFSPFSKTQELVLYGCFYRHPCPQASCWAWSVKVIGWRLVKKRKIRSGHFLPSPSISLCTETGISLYTETPFPSSRTSSLSLLPEAWWWLPLLNCCQTQCPGLPFEASLTCLTSFNDPLNPPHFHMLPLGLSLIHIHLLNDESFSQIIRTPPLKKSLCISLLWLP